MPNLVIAGVTKAGSTSLFAYLAQHPDIGPASVKELHYFSPIRFGLPPSMTVSEYASYFKGCADRRYLLEATPVYFYGGRPLAEAMRETLPDPRVVVVLRDPAERFISTFRYKKQMSRIDADLDFGTFLDRCRAELERDEVNAVGEGAYRSLVTGLYGRHLDAWFEAFGPRFQVVFSEQLKEGPAEVVSQLCRWLELDTEIVTSFDLSARNETFEPRNHQLNAAKNAMARAGVRVLRDRPQVRATLNRAYVALNGRAPTDQVSEEQRKTVRDLYRDSNMALAHTLRARGYTNLPAWLPARGG